MTLDVRFHQNITEEDLNDWMGYFWNFGQTLTEIIVDINQAKKISQWSIKLTTKSKKTIRLYESDFGILKITILK